jgi:SAM-dependent methyltransferase
VLPLGLTELALAAAAAESDLESLAAAQRMRSRFGPDLAAAALTQESLRRRAATKFGEDARQMFFTRDGLEQATRPAVAAHHAARFRAGGATGVDDLGCGVGADAIAFLRAGLSVRAVDVDTDTAAVAAANLRTVSVEGSDDGSSCAPTYDVVVGDAEREVESTRATTTSDWAWFADPARRNSTGRVWRLSDFSPSWPFVLRLLSGDRIAGVKLGPALPHADIPRGVEAEWVSHGGTTLEAALWAGGGAIPDARRATVIVDQEGPTSLLADATGPGVEIGPIGRYVYEPDGAVIRAGAIQVLAARLRATLIDPKIAYLSSDDVVPTPFAQAFEVLERLPYTEKALRGWMRERDIGSLEIKQRGIDLDPARLRRRLAPRGPAAATFLVTRTPKGATVLAVRRVPIT